MRIRRLAWRNLILGDGLCYCLQILWKVDTILFSMLILQCVCDSQGRVWRCHPNQFYAVEVTVPNLKSEVVRKPEQRTLKVLELLPSVSCLSPKEVITILSSGQDSGKCYSLCYGRLQVCYFHAYTTK